MRPVFFTDLDGTLIDHNNYCYEGSKTGVDLLAGKSIPLIVVSSKTFEEMSHFVRELHLNYPFAFENGTGIAFPSDDEEKFNLQLEGPGIEKILEFFPSLETLTGKTFRGITSFTNDEIVKLTGLDIKSSALAKKRMTTLPFVDDKGNVLSDTEINELNIILEEYSFLVTKGGRFNHLIPADSGKGNAVKKIIEFYKDKFKDEIVTAAAGDSANDIPMLESVDYPYVIRKPDGNFINFMPGKIMKSSGPAGFSEAVNDFLNIIAG